MEKVLVTGAAGFVAGYLVTELLSNGYYVVGIDNLSKYGKVERSYDDHPNYEFVEGDAKDADLLKELAQDCVQIVALAAKVGGVSYFYQFAYDLFAENERMTASTFDAAIHAFQKNKLKKINVISSSMVFEKTAHFPSVEGDQFACAPPLTTYGFQKLATEYFAKAAYQQYGLPYTIIIPFNCIGIGEQKPVSDEKQPGNIKLGVNHVIPDLIKKILVIEWQMFQNVKR